MKISKKPYCFTNLTCTLNIAIIKNQKNFNDSFLFVNIQKDQN